MRKRFITALLLPSLWACGGGDGLEGSPIDGRVDSGLNSGSSDGGASNYVDAGLLPQCSIVPSPFPMPTQFSGFLLSDTGDTSISTVNGGLGDDVFVLTAHNSRGVFSSGIATGTFAIEGPEADLDSCGLCVEVRADVSSQTNTPTMIFAAYSGEIEIQAISNQLGQEFNGSVTGLNLREIEADGNGGYVDVGGGCQLSVDDFAFNTTLQSPPSSN